MIHANVFKNFPKKIKFDLFNILNLHNEKQHLVVRNNSLTEKLNA